MWTQEDNRGSILIRFLCVKRKEMGRREGRREKGNRTLSEGREQSGVRGDISEREFGVFQDIEEAFDDF